MQENQKTSFLVFLIGLPHPYLTTCFPALRQPRLHPDLKQLRGSLPLSSSPAPGDIPTRMGATARDLSLGRILPNIFWRGCRVGSQHTERPRRHSSSGVTPFRPAHQTRLTKMREFCGKPCTEYIINRPRHPR